MLLINQIIFFMGVALLIFPILFIIVVAVYNSRVNKRIRAIEREVNEKNVKKFIRISKFGPFTRHDKRWERLTDMFKRVNKSKKISYELKKELFDILIKRGCDETKLNFKKKIK